MNQPSARCSTGPVPCTTVAYDGVRLRLLYEDHQLAGSAERLEALLDGFVQREEDSAQFITLFVRRNGQGFQITEEAAHGRVWLCKSKHSLVPYLEWLIHQLITEQLTDAIGLHAGVAGPSGHPILLMGRSGAGKSTLILNLIQSGWHYWTDDLAVISLNDACCRPYPKAIKFEGAFRGKFPYDRGSVLRFRIGTRPYRYVRPWRIPTIRWGQPAPVAAAIVLAQGRRREAHLSPLSPTALLKELAAHASINKERLPLGFETLCRLAEQVPAVRLAMGRSVSENARLIRNFAQTVLGPLV